MVHYFCNLLIYPLQTVFYFTSSLTDQHKTFNTTYIDFLYKYSVGWEGKEILVRVTASFAVLKSLTFRNL